MTEIGGFVLAVVAVLAAPGPTNTLLATAAASSGGARSLPLAGAAAIGYLVSTLAVALVLTPLAAASRELDIAMRVVCGAYLMFAAWRLWQEGGAANGQSDDAFRRVLFATSINPKGIIFATVVVPHLAPLRLAAAPYLVALGAMAVFVALIWIGIGAALRSSGRLDAQLARRVGAAVLAFFAVLVGASALTV